MYIIKIGGILKEAAAGQVAILNNVIQWKHSTTAVTRNLTIARACVEPED